MVAFANSRLAVIPESSTGTSAIEYTNLWPSQPVKLLELTLQDGNVNKNNNSPRGAVVVVCEDSTVWHVTLINGQLPAAPETQSM